jgi:ATP-dependent Clp protease protease subunit
MGGDWEAGLAIYDLINFSSCEVIMVGHGCLWSMGSVLLQAATKRYLMPHCNFMVHWGSEDISGDHLTVKTTMDYLEKESKRMIDIYTARCIRGKFFKDRGSDEEVVAKFIKAKLKTDWYMSAEEAVYYGFADKVLTKRTYNNARKAIKRTSPRTK